MTAVAEETRDCSRSCSLRPFGFFALASLLQPLDPPGRSGYGSMVDSIKGARRSQLEQFEGLARQVRKRQHPVETLYVLLEKERNP
jgi:hypothetical protein